MKLSVIIPTCNRKEILRETLNTIFSIVKIEVNNIEIIIVNDGTEALDDFEQLYDNTILKIYKNNNKGAASARNTGAQHANGEIVLFLDDDILPEPNHFNRHIEIHENHDNNLVVFAHRVYPDNIIKKAKQNSFGRYKLQYEYNCVPDVNTLKKFDENLYYVQNIPSYSCSLKKNIFYEIGSFNENFQFAGCEDAEFSYRALKRDIICLFDESNYCYHNELDNFELKRWLWRQSTGIKGAVIICKLHPEGISSPHWYSNSPINKNDTNSVKLLKIKKWILSRRINEKIIFFLTTFLVSIKVPDFIIFRFYNALWLGNSYRSFMEEYKKHFK